MSVHEIGSGLPEKQLRRSLSATITFLILSMPIPLAAHHGSAIYDTSKRVTVKATVTEWLWENPHCWLKFDVKDGRGTVTHWMGEANSPSEMLSRGWSKNSFKPGDEVTVTMIPAKNGAPTGLLNHVVLPSGLVLKFLPADEHRK